MQTHLVINRVKKSALLKHNAGVFEDNNNSLQLYSSFIHEDWSFLNGIVFLNCRGAFSLLYFQIVLFLRLWCFLCSKKSVRISLSLDWPQQCCRGACAQSHLWPCLWQGLDPVPWGVCVLDGPLGPAPRLVSGPCSGPSSILLLTGHP